MSKFTKALLAACWACMCVGNVPEASAQAQQAQPKSSASPDLDRARRMADSVIINKNFDLAVALFSDFFEFIHPIETKGFTQEIAIAEGPEEIDKQQLFFSPSPDVIHFEDGDAVYDYVPEVNEALIADRLSCLNSAIPMRLNDKVLGFINYFTVRRRDYTLRMLAKKNVYFPLFEKHLNEYGLPEDLKYLSIVESALDPRARSRAGAVGLWQFMPGTGKMLNLAQNNFVDERMDPEKSTVAACKYLLSLYRYFGNDWELALAAYNCGPGTVQRAIRRSGGKRDFWAIYRFLPAETRSYVPIFVAVTYMMNFAEEHNLVQDMPYYPIAAETVEVNQTVNIKALATYLNVCQEDLEELNPELKKGIVPGSAKKAYPLRVPADRADFFVNHRDEILAASRGPQREAAARNLLGRYWNSMFSGGESPEAESNNAVASNSKAIANTESGKAKYHTIRSGESLGLIAQKYGVSVTQLKRWNGMKSNMLQPGRKLKLYVGRTETAQDNASENVVAVAKPSTKPATKAAPAKPAAATKAKTHTVKNGENLWLIARKYGVTVEKIKQLNKMANDKLQPGQQLKVN